MGIPGTVNSGVPDTTLHWVPFTYTRTVNAYRRTIEGISTDDSVSPYPHNLFIADYNVTYYVPWDDLNTQGLIFGTAYASSGVDYTMRAPSVGSSYIGHDSNKCGSPYSNEWDSILDKDQGYIKYIRNKESFGQDISTKDSSKVVVRGWEYVNGWSDYNNKTSSHPDFGYRPVLELPAPDALNSGLRVVALNLNGGKIGSETGPVNIVVKSGGASPPPAART